MKILKESKSVMFIKPKSGINGDGFQISIMNNDKEVFHETYNYGYNASYDKDLAKHSQKDHDNAIKYGWDRVPKLQPYVSDIIDDLCKQYNVSKSDIEVVKGNNVFNGKPVSDNCVNNFKKKYLTESNHKLDSSEWNDLYNEYVPDSGKSDSLGGELLRAVSRIAYRYFNDGDILGYGYGNETVNAPARFILSFGNREMKNIINKMWDGSILDPEYDGCPVNKSNYRNLIEDLADATLKYLESDTEIFNKETVDMWDYFEDDDSDWYYEIEDDEYYPEDEW